MMWMSVVVVIVVVAVAAVTVAMAGVDVSDDVYSPVQLLVVWCRCIRTKYISYTRSHRHTLYVSLFSSLIYFLFHLHHSYNNTFKTHFQSFYFLSKKFLFLFYFWVLLIHWLRFNYYFLVICCLCSNFHIVFENFMHAKAKK